MLKRESTQQHALYPYCWSRPPLLRYLNTGSSSLGLYFIAQGLSCRKTIFDRKKTVKKLYQPIYIWHPKDSKTQIHQKPGNQMGLLPYTKSINKRVFIFWGEGPPLLRKQPCFSLQIHQKKDKWGPANHAFLAFFPHKRAIPTYHQIFDWTRNDPVNAKYSKQQSPQIMDLCTKLKSWSKNIRWHEPSRCFTHFP